MTWLLGILLVGSALMWLAQRRRILSLTRENQWLRRGGDLITGLLRAISGQDWQGALQGMADQLVTSGAVRATAIMAFSDTGELEVLAAASSVGVPPLSFQDETRAHLALESEEPIPSGDGGWLFPLWEGGEPVGLLLIAQAAPSFPARALAIRLAALLVNGFRTHLRQLALSNLDGLTGLANHRHFQQALAVAIGQAYLENEPLSIIYMDIDHFKEVNDRFGHQAGDTVLREFALLLRRELPSGALAARYGGEELVIMLQGERSLEAEAIAERLRIVVEAYPFIERGTGQHLNITVSLGVASYQLGQGKSNFIARADQALYISKREGRNRVTVAAPEADTRELSPT